MQPRAARGGYAAVGRVDQARGLASTDDIDAHVGGRLRARRTELGLSQATLGQHLGLTFSQVQKYEKGSNRIGAGRLYHLAALLGVSVPYFFEGLEGSQPGSPSDIDCGCGGSPAPGGVRQDIRPAGEAGAGVACLIHGGRLVDGARTVAVGKQYSFSALWAAS